MYPHCIHSEHRINWFKEVMAPSAPEAAHSERDNLGSSVQQRVLVTTTSVLLHK